MGYVFSHICVLRYIREHSTYLVDQVVPPDQGYPSLLVILQPHLDHLVPELHPDHPCLEVLERCIYWTGNNLYW